MSAQSPVRRVAGRFRGQGTLSVLLAGAFVVLIDLILTAIQGGGPQDVLERTAVLLVCVPVVAWFVVGRNARRSQALEQELQARQESLLRNISDLVLVLDDDGVVRYQSASVERTLGYAPDDLLTTKIDNLVLASDTPSVLALLSEIEPGGKTHLEGQVRRRDGQLVAIDLVATRAAVEERVAGFVVTMHDVSKWKELEAQLTREAFHDSLTGLPNRALYIDRLEQALGRRRRHSRNVAALFLDLDDFKMVNDSFGHDAGDILIRQVATRLLSSIRPGDTAARFGGDEFAVLLEDVDEDQTIAVTKRIYSALELPFDLGDRSLLVNASVGIALSSDDLPDVLDLLRASDTAMYEAKDAGKGKYRVFQPEMHEASTKRLRLGADLRGAVERGEFVVHYQPIVDLPSGEVASMEALVRWARPDGGLVPPNEFIPLAERSGLIVPIGEFVVREACRQVRTWQLQRPGRAIGISVNVSGVQLQDSGFVAAVSLALEEADLAPEHLTLEITESVMALDDEAVHRRLRQLKGLGVRLAIDDFGTGFSSLGSIGRFPVDEVKIDKSFVDALADGRQAVTLVRSIVRLAHSLKLTAVAEGVESEDQARALAAAGCDKAQGYVISRPMDTRQASAYLLGHSTVTLWMGYAGQELEVLSEVVRDFETRHPGIKVELVGGVADDRIIEALQNGSAPDIVSSFESGNFGTYASAGGLVDLAPYLERDHIDDTIFTEAARSYTSRGSRRWALPMLADAYGLYFNRDLLAAAGLAGPPRTMTELADYAKRLTKRRPDGSLLVVGFNPLFGFYENDVSHFGHIFGASWFGEHGESALGRDPAWAAMLRWQKELVDWYGLDDLRTFGEEVGEEFSSGNAFEKGRLGLCLDGEWRVGFIAANGSRVSFGTAPLPVADGRPELYGSGPINGTIIGLPSGVEQRDDSWQLIKYLTTNDAALVKMANGLRNIPSTTSALQSRDLVRDAATSVFLDIFAHPRSTALPLTSIGTAYEGELATFVERWQVGEVPDLRAGLLEVDRQINGLLRHPGTATASASASTSLHATRGWLGAQSSSPDLRAAAS
jgi:diguanylate cyclase (GGDEF)-like protein/PAS domain S-box-containing protein